MVMGVSHVKLSIDVGKITTNTIPRVSSPRTLTSASGSPLSNQSQEHDPPRLAGGAKQMGLRGAVKTTLRVQRIYITI